MPLLSFAKTDPTSVAQLSVQQLVAAAGEGELLDSSLCSAEFREYLTQVEPERIAAYSAQCLTQPLQKGGQILQDLVNELGRRLGYQVSNGRYSGVVGHVGYDGLWSYPGLPSLVVEVKTTDAYRLSLDKLAEYQRKLVEKELCSPDASILIVVGRQDTGELEAQVRGSRHAWSVRLISVESLIQLVAIKLEVGSPQVNARIRNLLRPAEYTRLDALIELVFSAAKDVDGSEPLPVQGGDGKAVAASPETTGYDFTPTAELHAKRALIVSALGKKRGVELKKQSRATYTSPDDKVRAIISLSKRYHKPAGRPYWYAYHPDWDDFLEGAPKADFVLGMMDRQEAYALPVETIRILLPKLNTTTPANGKTYWHIHIMESGGELSINVPGGDNLPLAAFAVGPTE